MPKSRLDELIELAEEQGGLLTAASARNAGVADSVLVRLAQRGRLERVARGVYRIPHVGDDRLAQYRELVLWAKANRGPDLVALSHETALVIYGISDANPATVHLSVPREARLRRGHPKGLRLHRSDLRPDDISIHEGLPVTTIPRTVDDLLEANSRTDLIRQAIGDARREGYLARNEARRLRDRVDRAVSRLQGPSGEENSR